MSVFISHLNKVIFWKFLIVLFTLDEGRRIDGLIQTDATPVR